LKKVQNHSSAVELIASFFGIAASQENDRT